MIIPKEAQDTIDALVDEHTPRLMLEAIYRAGYHDGRLTGFKDATIKDVDKATNDGILPLTKEE